MQCMTDGKLLSLIDNLSVDIRREAMKPNIKEPRHFEIIYLDELWKITAAWISQKDGSICWYEGQTTRNNTIFKRAFSPEELKIWVY